MWAWASRSHSEGPATVALALRPHRSPPRGGIRRRRASTRPRPRPPGRRWSPGRRPPRARSRTTPAWAKSACLAASAAGVFARAGCRSTRTSAVAPARRPWCPDRRSTRGGNASLVCRTAVGGPTTPAAPAATPPGRWGDRGRAARGARPRRPRGPALRRNGQATGLRNRRSRVPAPVLRGATTRPPGRPQRHAEARPCGGRRVATRAASQRRRSGASPRPAGASGAGDSLPRGPCLGAVARCRRRIPRERGCTAAASRGSSARGAAPLDSSTPQPGILRSLARGPFPITDQGLACHPRVGRPTLQAQALGSRPHRALPVVTPEQQAVKGVQASHARLLSQRHRPGSAAPRPAPSWWGSRGVGIRRHQPAPLQGSAAPPWTPQQEESCRRCHSAGRQQGLARLT
mmetsp:Transcript_123379/g.348637  ORF Transcript_123379/g.348637 Transcript_123379/m.348637 type:complete len:404 (-) Transcript_123379:1343-2554(-)